MLDVDETIAAVASPPRGGLRGIVRLSGTGIVDCLTPWFTAKEGGDWSQLTRATVVPGQVQLDDSGRFLPCELFFWPTKRSYTHQPTAELHLIGSPPLLQRIVTNLCQTGARLARPGEFTLRAFLAGRLDLAQAEAVLGVIDATNDRQLDVALRQLAGGLSSKMHALRSDLLDLIADLEAGLDFVEEDIAFVTPDEVARRLTRATDQVAQAIDQMHSRATPTDVPRVALVGHPNVGKSSLLNALAGESAAIVSNTAGTTTDYLRVSSELGGIPCELIDTAGREPSTRVAEGTTPVEHAQKMAETASAHATLVLVCIDLSRSATAEELERIARRDEERELIVGTKSDLPRDAAPVRCDVAVSSTVAADPGRTELVQLIVDRLATDRQLAGDTVVTTALRCRRSLEDCYEGLMRAHQLCSSVAGDEIVVAELRIALDAIGQVVGVVYTDDVLDRVFSRFCIGK